MFFLDVGQGTCNVVLLGGRRAIVVDAGPRQAARIPIQLLDRYVDRIAALIISHNDVDHCGGAQRILERYPRAIDRVYYLLDRALDGLPLYDVIQHEIERGHIEKRQVFRLERQAERCLLYEDEADAVALELLHPSFIQNQEALEGQAPNASSGLLMLFCGPRRILFSGDLELPGWKDVVLDAGVRITCDVMTAPHHGGRIDATTVRGKRRVRVSGKRPQDFRWLYSEAVRSQFVVVSVGTSNTHKHPLPEHVAAIRESGAAAVCTQITKQCTDVLERCRPGVLPPQPATVPLLSRPAEDLTGGCNSRNVACAGSIVAEVTPTSVELWRVREHQRNVDLLAASSGARPNPLCRR